MRNVKVALAQMSPVLRNKHENISRMSQVVDENEADLYVFGEMFLTGYSCKDEFHRLAEPLSGESVRAVAELAEERNATIVFGMPEHDEHSQAIFNSCVVVTPDGNAFSYRKLHPANFGPFEEKLYFKPGNRLDIIDTPVGRLGCLICYDIFFPEVCKSYALKGAEILVCISAGPTASMEYFEKVMFARAIENTTFVLFCNLAGSESSMIYFGGSTVIGPRGDLKAAGRHLQEQIVKTEIDLEELKIARRFRPTLRNTRADILEQLADSDTTRPKN